MRGRLPIEPQARADIDVGADAKPAALDDAVPFELLADAVPAQADERIPEAGRAREPREVVDGDVVIERDASDPGGDEEIGRDLESHVGVAVNQIRIDDQEGPLRPIAA